MRWEDVECICYVNVYFNAVIIRMAESQSYPTVSAENGTSQNAERLAERLWTPSNALHGESESWPRSWPPVPSIKNDD